MSRAFQDPCESLDQSKHVGAAVCRHCDRERVGSRAPGIRAAEVIHHTDTRVVPGTCALPCLRRCRDTHRRFIRPAVAVACFGCQ